MLQATSSQEENSINYSPCSATSHAPFQAQAIE